MKAFRTAIRVVGRSQCDRVALNILLSGCLYLMPFVPLDRLLSTEGLGPKEQLFAQNQQFESELNLVALRCFFATSLNVCNR